MNFDKAYEASKRASRAVTNMSQEDRAAVCPMGAQHDMMVECLRRIRNLACRPNAAEACRNITKEIAGLTVGEDRYATEQTNGAGD